MAADAVKMQAMPMELYRPVTDRVAEDASQVERWARQSGWEAECRQLGSGSFRSRFQPLVCGRLSVVLQRSNRDMINRLNSPAGVVPVIFGMSGDLLGLFEGREMDGDDVTFAAQGREGLFRPRTGVVRCMITLPTSLMASTLAQRHGKVFRGGSEPYMFHKPGSSMLEKLRNQVRVLYQAEGTGLGRYPEAVAELEEGLVAAVVDLFASQAAADAPKAGLRNRFGYVRKAREIMEDMLGEGLRMSEIASAVGVSGRTLEFAFQDVLGVRPVEFLKMKRLNRAQRLLLERKDGVMVRDVAAACGLRHLGYFSRDYRAMFGESPSDTRRKARCVSISSL